MIILVGASGGLGKVLVGKLSKIEQVVGTFNNSSVLGLDSGNNRISYQKLDLCNETEILEFVNRNKKNLKRITVIFMAGASHDDLIVNHDSASWKNVLDINLTSNFMLVKALLPLMIKQKWGRIIHISSIRANIGTVSYSASKFGLLGLSAVISKEYAKFNITSNVLVLGAFKAGLYEKLSEKLKKEMLNEIPSRTLGEVQDICNAVMFLINSQFVNGSSIVLDGGAST